ncbi:MAG TPA: trypsin-like peptidase domain-containing protein [Xanthobacteraceae bacterium]|jgi:S1-C subfamily serine protease|nr:trypsin-like peptidase domain-containing protein [Xanthobacteraceae bacterium]
MGSRSFRYAIALMLIVLAVMTIRPYIEYRLYAATTPRPVEARGSLADYENSAIEVFERVSPSVVHVVGRSGANELSPFGGDEAGIRTGTGFIWDQAGHVVTNDHVVEGTKVLAVRLASGEAVKAMIVGLAPHYDLAVIRVASVRELPQSIMVGSSADLKVGQAAFAIGNPFGLDQSLTSGIISALKRRLPTSGGREIGNVIQTDAAINPGNSGGPLLDSAGRLIGVNTAIFSPSGSNAGIGFAIPVDIVNRIVPELIRNGRVPAPGIGIVAGNETIATRLGVEGVIVLRTVSGSPAARAGLQGVNVSTGELGDVIVAANGQPIRRLADLAEQVEQVGVGKTIELMLRHGGNKTSKTVEVTDVEIRATPSGLGIL